MTVEIISWSISTKVWDRAGIELATPGSAVRHASVARHITDCATRPGTISGGQWLNLLHLNSQYCRLSLWLSRLVAMGPYMIENPEDRFSLETAQIIYKWKANFSYTRTLVKKVYQKNIFFISKLKHMLWVLKRTVSMRRFFWAPKHMLKLMGKKTFTKFTQKSFVYLNLCYSLLAKAILQNCQVS